MWKSKLNTMDGKINECRGVRLNKGVPPLRFGFGICGKNIYGVKQNQLENSACGDDSSPFTDVIVRDYANNKKIQKIGRDIKETQPQWIDFEIRDVNREYAQRRHSETNACGSGNQSYTDTRTEEQSKYAKSKNIADKSIRQIEFMEDKCL